MSSDYRPADLLVYETVAEMISAFPQPVVHYENNGAILLKDCGFEYDEAFIATLVFPAQWKKIGSFNGITKAPVVFENGGFSRTDNPLCSICEDDRLLLKMYSEFLRLELSFRLLVHQVFPTYRNIDFANCTFRFTPTRDENIHLDVFNRGQPFPPKWQQPRLKLFLNVDSEPRIWNVGPTLPEVLKHARLKLQSRLPADVNMLCKLLSESGVLDCAPLAQVEIPSRGVIFANGGTVVHQVVYGNRVIGLEAGMPTSSMYTQIGCEWDNLRGWIADAGYEFEEISAPYIVGAPIE